MSEINHVSAEVLAGALGDASPQYEKQQALEECIGILWHDGDEGTCCRIELPFVSRLAWILKQATHASLCRLERSRELWRDIKYLRLRELANLNFPDILSSGGVVETGRVRHRSLAFLLRM